MHTLSRSVSIDSKFKAPTKSSRVKGLKNSIFPNILRYLYTKNIVGIKLYRKGRSPKYLVDTFIRGKGRQLVLMIEILGMLI